MLLTWVSLCLVTAPLIIIFLVCLKSVLICQGGFGKHCIHCITMLTLFKSIVLSRLDYGSQLRSQFLIKHINQLERIQRSLTKHIKEMDDMPYHERLKSLVLYSLQRRRETYCIIYIWKIIEGLAPNFSNPSTHTLSERTGRTCVISHVNVGRVDTLAYNSSR